MLPMAHRVDWVNGNNFVGIVSEHEKTWTDFDETLLLVVSFCIHSTILSQKNTHTDSHSSVEYREYKFNHSHSCQNEPMNIWRTCQQEKQQKKHKEYWKPNEMKTGRVLLFVSITMLVKNIFCLPFLCSYSHIASYSREKKGNQVVWVEQSWKSIEVMGRCTHTHTHMHINQHSIADIFQARQAKRKRIWTLFAPLIRVFCVCFFPRSFFLI